MVQPTFAIKIIDFKKEPVTRLFFIGYIKKSSPLMDSGLFVF